MMRFTTFLVVLSIGSAVLLVDAKFASRKEYESVKSVSALIDEAELEEAMPNTRVLEEESIVECDNIQVDSTKKLECYCRHGRVLVTVLKGAKSVTKCAGSNYELYKKGKCERGKLPKKDGGTGAYVACEGENLNLYNEAIRAQCREGNGGMCYMCDRNGMYDTCAKKADAKDPLVDANGPLLRISKWCLDRADRRDAFTTKQKKQCSKEYFESLVTYAAITGTGDNDYFQVDGSYAEVIREALELEVLKGIVVDGEFHQARVRRNKMKAEEMWETFYAKARGHEMGVERQECWTLDFLYEMPLNKRTQMTLDELKEKATAAAALLLKEKATQAINEAVWINMCDTFCPEQDDDPKRITKSDHGAKYDRDGENFDAAICKNRWMIAKEASKLKK